MGCPDPRPAPAERWARASARLSLVGVVAWALALAPIAAGHRHAAPPADAAVAPSVVRHLGHGVEPASGTSDVPTDEATHDVHCLACLVGAMATPDPAAVAVGPRNTVRATRPRAPLVAAEHHRHVRSRAPPPSAAL